MLLECGVALDARLRKATIQSTSAAYKAPPNRVKAETDWTRLKTSLAEYRAPEGLDPATRHARLMSGSATLGAPRPSPRREAWPDSCDVRQPRGRLRPRP